MKTHWFPMKKKTQLLFSLGLRDLKRNVILRTSRVRLLKEWDRIPTDPEKVNYDRAMIDTQVCSGSVKRGSISWIQMIFRISSVLVVQSDHGTS